MPINMRKILPRNRRFTYQPRYYDERKERLEQMRSNANREYIPGQHINFREVAEDRYRTKNDGIFNSRSRMYILMAVAITLVYLIFKRGDLVLYYVERLFR